MGERPRSASADAERGVRDARLQSVPRDHRPVHRVRSHTRDRYAGREYALEDRQRTHASAWVPTTDIFVQGDRLVIRIELAGVDPENIDLRFANGVLTVSGNRSGEFGPTRSRPSTCGNGSTARSGGRSPCRRGPGVTRSRPPSTTGWSRSSSKASESGPRRLHASSAGTGPVRRRPARWS